MSTSKQSCRLLPLVSIVIIAVLTGCGGGGGSSPTPSTTPAVNNPSPIVSALSPSTAVVGAASAQVTVTGSGFISSSTVQWNGSPRPTTFVSGTQLTVTLSSSDLAATGSGQVTVTNPAPGGGTSAAAAFSINNPAPVVSGVSPASVLAGSTASTLTITGSGFVSGSTVQWNGTNRATTVVSSTQLQVAVAATDVSNAGTVQITVVNAAPGGGTSSATPFTIANPAPAVASVAPALYVTDVSQTITVTGTGFSTQSVVQWNGSNRTTTFLSSTQLQTTLSGSDLSSPSTASVSVSNPAPGGGGSGALSVDVTYAVPVVNSLSPNAVTMGSPDTTINVSGTGFAPASRVVADGVVLNTVYVYSGLIRAVVPSTMLASAGTSQITVVTPAPGGGTSAAKSLSITTYPVPVITSVSLFSVYVNSPSTGLTVYGNGLQPVSTIQVNGTAITTTYNSLSHSLFATIPASYFTSVGTLRITVYTPPPSGGTSNEIDIPVVSAPAPIIANMSPTSAPLGGNDFTLTVNGSNFTPASVVQWNGSSRPTTFASTYQLTATISRADIATFTQALVSVTTPAPGGGTTGTLPFNTYLALPVNDIVYNSVDNLLYASVPSSAGTTYGNSVVAVDLNTGVIGAPIWVGSEPNKLALSSDGLYLWVGLDGAGAVRKVDLTTKTAGMQFGLGGGTGIYNSPNVAASIAVMPGTSDTVAVASSNYGTWWDGGTVIYDAGVPRAKSFANGGTLMTVNAVAFSASGSTLYAVGNGYAVLNIDATGVATSAVKNSTASATSMVYDSGNVYLSSGVVLNADTGVQLGVFSVSSTQQANGPVAVDSVLGRAFVLVNPNYSGSYQINAYNTATYTATGNLPVGSGTNFIYSSGLPKVLRWGQDGLVYKIGNQIFVGHTTLVRDLSASIADLSVSASAPATAATGADVTYNVTIANQGPVTASPAVLLAYVPSGTVLKSATSSQGTCTGVSVVRCDLGDLAASASATVQVVATMLSPGTPAATFNVSAPQGDANLANNTATASVTVTGNAYSAVPVLTAISPEIVSAGSGSFIVTASGAGFVNGATIGWNGAPLATTFVNDSTLTAQVDSSNVTSLGWGWITVTNPAPGGGTSAKLPLSIYTTVNLSSNHLVFDPFTRKLYASIPSTATQVTGNSIVAIDPYTGSVGSPINIGSEPNRLAESPDGNYLYVGIDGAKSLTRVNLASMTQGSIYPLNVNSPYATGPATARWIAVMPGNDDTLAIDTGSWTGIGIFDLSTGTFRTHMTGAYTGSSLTFANASTLYSYDSDTSGATFNRWTVDANGLTAIDQTTLFGIGGFSGAFRLIDGLIYGTGGGIADPSTTPPAQVGRYLVGNIGLNQSLQPSSMTADTAANRAFFLGSSTAGTALPFLASFDRTHFTVIDTIQLPGQSLTGTDVTRWGSDGLAWQMSGWPSGSSNTIFIMRGPWVLPQLANNNPVASATSVTPSSAAAGTGNIVLTVTGSGLVPGAVVLWNGVERTTSFVDSTHLSVAIPAADLTSAGTATLTIVNPGASASTGVTFTIH